MSCPQCGVEDRRDDATGYHGADICPDCATQGWTYGAHGNLINEREGPCEVCASSEYCVGCGYDSVSCRCWPKREPEPVSEMDQIRR